MKKIFYTIILTLLLSTLFVGCKSEPDIPKDIAAANTIYTITENQLNLQKTYLLKYREKPCTAGELKKDLSDYKTKIQTAIDEVSKVKYSDKDNPEQVKRIDSLKNTALHLLNKRLEAINHFADIVKDKNDSDIATFNAHFAFSVYSSDFYLNKTYSDILKKPFYICPYNYSCGVILKNNLGVAPVVCMPSNEGTIDIGFGVKNFNKQAIDISTLEAYIVIGDETYSPKIMPSEQVIMEQNRITQYGFLEQLGTFNPREETVIFRSFIIRNWNRDIDMTLADLQLRLNGEIICQIPLMPFQTIGE